MVVRSKLGLAVAVVLALAIVVIANYFSVIREQRADRSREEEAAQQAREKTPPPKPEGNNMFGAEELKALGAGADPEKYADVDGSVVRIQTDKGDIVIRLFDEDAPITVDNFLRLAAAGFYDGLVFHRVEPGFVIQTGDPKGTGMGGPGWQIPDEIHENNRLERGTVGMANSGPNTGGSQFFVCMKRSEHLDERHTAFGEVLEGMQVVEAIRVKDAMRKVVIEKHRVLPKSEDDTETARHLHAS